MKPRCTTLAATCGALFLLCAGLRAQSPITRAIQSVERRAGHNMEEAAEDMPEDRYGFSPTPDQLSFGQIVLDVAGENFLLCTALNGTPIPEQHHLSPTDPKDLLEQRLEGSFDLCNAALEHADDANLGDSVALFDGRKMTRESGDDRACRRLVGPLRSGRDIPPPERAAAAEREEEERPLRPFPSEMKQ
jgi:hypothetical protein